MRVPQVEEWKKPFNTSLYGRSRIRVRYVEATKKSGGHYTLRCGDCHESLDIYPAQKDDGPDPTVEINGIIGTQANWRDILLPILGIPLNRKKK